MKLLLLSLLAVLALDAQPRATHVVLSTRTSVTADKVTLQQSASSPVLVQPIAAVIQATVTGTVYVEHTGTAATTTTSTPVSTIPGGSAATFSGYSNSNVGSGTRCSIIYKLAANTPLTLDMTTMAFSGSGTTKNITVVIALDSSGDVQTAVYAKEN